MLGMQTMSIGLHNTSKLQPCPRRVATHHARPLRCTAQQTSQPLPPTADVAVLGAGRHTVVHMAPRMLHNTMRTPTVSTLTVSTPTNPLPRIPPMHRHHWALDSTHTTTAGSHHSCGHARQGHRSVSRGHRGGTGVLLVEPAYSGHTNMGRVCGEQEHVGGVLRARGGEWCCEPICGGCL